MKAVLLSIQPKWCEKIANGEKTIEVRKTRPKIKTPFKCYMYCTRNGATLMQTVHTPMHVVGSGYNNIKLACHKAYTRVRSMHDCVNGKVIGEFICDYMDEFHEWQLSPNGQFQEAERDDLNNFLKVSCLTWKEVWAYRKSLIYCKPLYIWHVSDLKIYDQPKELNEFFKLSRPPQSWCYVEEI